MRTKTRSALVGSLLLLVSLALVVPPDISSQAGQRAGQVSRVIPAVNLRRGARAGIALGIHHIFPEDRRLCRGR